jgi:hypothetical protein
MKKIFISIGNAPTPQPSAHSKYSGGKKPSISFGKKTFYKKRENSGEQI